MGDGRRAPSRQVGTMCDKADGAKCWEMIRRNVTMWATRNVATESQIVRATANVTWYAFHTV